jgi:hypothetical protein
MTVTTGNTTNPNLGGTGGKLAALLTGVAQTLMTTLRNNERNPRREREEDKTSKSLIRSLGPTQQALFLTLATDDLRDPPQQSTCMKSVLACRSANATVIRIRLEMTAWHGSVFLAGLHRFFSNRFKSQENNSADPGGALHFHVLPPNPQHGSRQGAATREP